MVGTRSQAWSMIPTTDGAVTMPAVTLTWFNTTTERIETSELPQRALRVFGPVGAPSTSAAQTTTQTDPVAVTANDEPTRIDISERRVFNPWISALLVLALGLAGWLLRHRFKSFSTNQFGHKLRPEFLRLRAARAELTEIIDVGSARDIRSTLKNTTQQYTNACKPIDSQALAALYALLDTAAYAPVTRELNRQELHALAAQLFAEHKQDREELSLPELYG